MLRFVDGPAADVALACARAPFFLRLVRSQNGDWDALDQLADMPRPREKIWVYLRMGNAGSYHLLCTPRKNSGWYASGNYRLAPHQPADAIARNREAWRQWCEREAEAILLMHPRATYPDIPEQGNLFTD